MNNDTSLVRFRRKNNSELSDNATGRTHDAYCPITQACRVHYPLTSNEMRDVHVSYPSSTYKNDKYILNWANDNESRLTIFFLVFTNKWFLTY